MNSSPARVEILWPKQVIWLPRPQIKLVWFNFRFGAIQQPYITADIFHYPAKAGGGRGQGCRSPQEDIIALLWHTFSPSHSFPPSYNVAIYNTQTHRAVTARTLERIRYIQIIVIVSVRSVRDDVNSIIATVLERKCVCVCKKNGTLSQSDAKRHFSQFMPLRIFVRFPGDRPSHWLRWHK